MPQTLTTHARDQVQDDVELLDLMLSDMQTADPVYQPTNYWAWYQERTVEFLRTKGLHDFRASDDGFLASFGGNDLPCHHAPIRDIARTDLPDDSKEKLAYFLNIAAQNVQSPLLPYGLSVNDITESAYRMCMLYAKDTGARPVSEAESSTVGRPANAVRIDGRTYAPGFFSYYWRYATCSRFIDFDRIDNIVEIGSGAGKQVEVIKKLHPHINFFLLDLAPQLYVCNRYLSAVFPQAAVDYRTTREESTVRAGGRGEIRFLPNAKIESLELEGNTLFWNAASFGEMEPEVVRRYLEEVREFADAVYLFQCMNGKERGTPGEGGVLEPTCFAHYERFLGEQFSLLERASAYSPLKRITQSGGYEDAVWLRQSPSSRRVLRGA